MLYIDEGGSFLFSVIQVSILCQQANRIDGFLRNLGVLGANSKSNCFLTICFGCSSLLISSDFLLFPIATFIRVYFVKHLPVVCEYVSIKLQVGDTCTWMKLK